MPFEANEEIEKAFVVLAEKLGYTSEAVISAVRRLEKVGLIEVSDKGIRPTRLGAAKALSTLAKAAYPEIAKKLGEADETGGKEAVIELMKELSREGLMEENAESDSGYNLTVDGSCAMLYTLIENIFVWGSG